MVDGRRLTHRRRFAALAVMALAASSGADSLRVPPSAAPGTAGAAVRNVVALTFDDGPSAQYTPQILDELRDAGVHATFFVIGRNAAKFPDLVKREVAEGHAVGNHTWSHPMLAPFESRRHLTKEIMRTDSAVFSAAGVHLTLFRPPHGWRSPWMMKSVEGLGYDVVNWTVDPKDWKHPRADVVVKRVDHALGSSAIVLLHDGLEMKKDPGEENTVVALREIITDFKARGYEFVTISQLINAPRFAGHYRRLFKEIAEPARTYR